jgi:phosphoribosyl 1,2-cyclic phosphodiesterase
MTLVEFFQVGSSAINQGWIAFNQPSAYLDGFTMGNIFVALAFMQITGWFFARIVKGKSAKPPSGESEDITKGELAGGYTDESISASEGGQDLVKDEDTSYWSSSEDY